VGGNTFPVGFRLQATVAIRRAWIFIVDKGHVVTHENVVLNDYSLAYECVARDLAAAPNPRTFLYFNKSADLGIVPKLAAIQISEAEDSNILPEFNVGSDLLVHWS
jgi:hypothetical protein